MSEPKKPVQLKKNSWTAQKPHWGVSAFLGTLISVGGFTLVLWALAWFMPNFFRFVHSRWAPLLPAISILFICTGGLVRFLRKRDKTSEILPKSSLTHLPDNLSTAAPGILVSLRVYLDG
jgi:hypothetical protein